MTTVHNLATGNQVGEHDLPAKEAVEEHWKRHHKSTFIPARIAEEMYYPLDEGVYGWTKGIFWAEKDWRKDNGGQGKER